MSRAGKKAAARGRAMIRGTRHHEPGAKPRQMFGDRAAPAPKRAKPFTQLVRLDDLEWGNPICRLTPPETYFEKPWGADA